MPRPAAFAVPGDLMQTTGGTIYDRRLIEALRAAGREVVHLELPASFPAPPPADMDRALALLADQPADRPVVVDGLAYAALDTVGLAAVQAPLVALVHHPVGLETGLDPARARALLRQEAQNLALAAHVVVPSPHTAAILARDFGVPEAALTVALPGFAAPDPVRAPIDPPLILAVGLLAARKGHDVLIDALAQVADLPWQARIVGGAQDAAVVAALTAQIARLDLGARVTLRGRLDTAALTGLYRQASVFALATRYEGYGMVFGEALLHGLPIVTCAAGAVPDTVPPGTGLLTPVDDAAAFAGSLRRLLTDDALRARMAAAATAAGHALPRWTETAATVGAVLDAL